MACGKVIVQKQVSKNCLSRRPSGTDMVRRLTNRAGRWTREPCHYLLTKQLIATLPPSAVGISAYGLNAPLLCQAPIVVSECREPTGFRLHRRPVHVLRALWHNQPNAVAILEFAEGHLML